MAKLSPNQVNDLWRNARLTITTIVLPAIGITGVAYMTCEPFHKFVDDKVDKILNHKKKKEKTEE